MRDSPTDGRSLGYDGMKTVLCHHSLIELDRCDPELLKEVSGIRTALLRSVEAGSGTMVESVFHAFSPWGVSGVVVITESHVTIHTWPEHGYAAVDILSCSSKLNHEIIAESLRAGLKAGSLRIQTLKRGPMALPDDRDAGIGTL